MQSFGFWKLTAIVQKLCKVVELGSAFVHLMLSLKVCGPVGIAVLLVWRDSS